MSLICCHRALLVGLALLLALAASPAWAAYALVGTGHVGAMSTNGTDVTTGNIDTTGATLIICAVAVSHGQTTPCADSQSNTWTPLSAFDNASGCIIRFYYVVNPTTSATHNFVVNVGAAGFPSVTVLVVSGNAASPADQETGNTGTGTSIATGPVTPAEGSELVVAAACQGGVVQSMTADSGFTTIEDQNGSANAYGNHLAYLIETSIAAQNVTFTGGSSTNNSAAIATFKATGGGGGGGGMKCVVGGGFFGPGCM